jgi:hypothetical protein
MSSGARLWVDALVAASVEKRSRRQYRMIFVG